MTTGGHPPPEIKRRSLYVQQPSYGPEVIIMSIMHYGTQTVCRAAIQPGMLIKHHDTTWTASANVRGCLYLHRGFERTYTKELLVEVYLNGLGDGLKH